MAPSKNYRAESFLWVTTDKNKGKSNASKDAAAKHYFFNDLRILHLH